MLPYVIMVLIGYLMGSSNMAWYLSQLRAVDLRSGGSGNLGTSNAIYMMGWRAGVLTAVHDVGKSALAVLLAQWLFPQARYIGHVAGVAAVLGHNFPFYLKFKGGKGLAAYMGMILALEWKLAFLIAGCLLLITIVTDYIIFGTVATAIYYPIHTYNSTGSWVPAAIVGLASIVMIVRHRENYVRIWKGNEIGALRYPNGWKYTEKKVKK